MVSVTPSGGWVPAVIAGKTGIGLSQRAQSFVLTPAENPFNVIEPQRPQVTLTPTLCLRTASRTSFAVQGGDSQDQNLLQFFLNIVEFGMTVQESTEAPNFNTYRSGIRSASTTRSRAACSERLHAAVGAERPSGPRLSAEYQERTSGPINAIFFDQKHGTFWGARATTARTTASRGELVPNSEDQPMSLTFDELNRFYQEVMRPDIERVIDTAFQRESRPHRGAVFPVLIRFDRLLVGAVDFHLTGWSVGSGPGERPAKSSPRLSAT